MEYERALLVNFDLSYSNYGLSRPFVGLAYVAEALEQNGIEYDIIDMNLGYDWQALSKKIETFRPDLVCFQMMSLMYKNAYDLVSKVKKKYPEVVAVGGGPHISLFRKKSLEDSQLDLGVVLEGEKTIIEICKGKEYGKIKGLLWRDGNDIVYNGDRPFIEDLDSINFPTYKKYELERYPSRQIGIATSRGCPYQCIFCGSKLSIGSCFRMRSAKNVVDEFEYWVNRGYTHFDIVDDNFTLETKRVFDICDEIDKRGLKIRISSGNGIRADRVTREMLQRMKDIGFYYLTFGVESGDDRILSVLKKGEKLETIEAAVKNACDVGIEVVMGFLIGSPTETREDVYKSFRLALKYPVADARFYNLIPYPNTELFIWIKENNYFLKDPEEYMNDASGWEHDPLFETPELTCADRKELLAIGRKIRWKVRSTAYGRRFGLGPFGNVLGRVAATDLVSNKFEKNPALKKLLRTTKRVCNQR